MNSQDKISINFKFVKMGEVAPDPVPKDEIWIDVGSRIGPQIIDHHFENPQAWSASELVLNKHRELIINPLREVSNIIIVTHSKPDLDSICSIWLVIMLLHNKKLPNPKSVLDFIVRYVSDNDQGLIRTQDPKTNWVIVFRTLLNVEYVNMDDKSRVEAGIANLDKTFIILKNNGTFEDAANLLITSKVRIALEHSYRDYLEDLSRASIFQVRLPFRSFKNSSYNDFSSQNYLPLDKPDHFGNRWSLADALYLENPQSQLFKELARGDIKHSPLKQGFALLLISRHVKNYEDIILWRHIISTDPLTGLHLQGLGKKLELLEESKEEESNLPLFSGRERVKTGTGRHGYDVSSPWYDGRGHYYTIIDSPSVITEGDELIASRLSPDEILNAIWEYGDPSQFVTLLQSEITFFVPIELQNGWESYWTEELSFSYLTPDFDLDVVQSLSTSHEDNGFKIRSSQNKISYRVKGFRFLNQYLIYLSEQEALWIIRFANDNTTKTIFELLMSLNMLGEEICNDFLPACVKPISEDNIFRLTHCRIKSSEFSTEDSTSYSPQIMHRVSAGIGCKFHDQPSNEEISLASRVLSRDRKSLFYVTSHGFGVFSTRSTSFEEDNDFQKPMQFVVLFIVALMQKIALKQLQKKFILHRSEFSSTRPRKKILTDRWRLMQIEQKFSFSRITEKVFGQKSYETIKTSLGIDALLLEIKQKIEVLSDYIRDTQSDFLQKIGFWVSLIFAPLAITVGFFSGSHLKKNFFDENYSLLPEPWQSTGFIEFILFFFLVSVITFVIWLIISIGYKREKI